MSILAFKTKTKLCCQCKKELPVSDFNKCTAAKDGLQYRCKICDRETCNRNREKRKDGYKQYLKDYRNRKRYDFEWRLQALLNASKQRALLKGREHKLTRKDLINLYPKDGKCPIFGILLEWNESGFRETSPSIDRIDSSKGYTIDNVQIISWKANRIKSYATIEELEIVLSYMKSGG